MNIGIGVCVAIHTEDLACVMDILIPFLRIHVERANCAIACDLRNFRLSMAGEALLIRIARWLRKRHLNKKEQWDEKTD